MSKPKNNSNVYLEYFKIFIYGVVTPSIIMFGIHYVVNDIVKDSFKNALKDGLKEAFKESFKEKLDDVIDSKNIKDAILNKFN